MPHPIHILHYLSPLLLLPPTLTLFRAPSPPPPELPGIRPIITKHVIPRCSLILTVLSLLAASYLADGLTFVVSVVVTKEWNADVPLSGRGDGWAWVVYAAGGLVLWSTIAVLCAALNVYERNGIVVAATFGLVCEVVLLVFLVLDFTRNSVTATIAHITSIIHIILPSLRLILLPLLIYAVSNPIIRFLPVESSSSSPSTDPDATERTGLIEHQESTASLRPTEGDNSEINGSTSLPAINGKQPRANIYGTFGANTPPVNASGTALPLTPAQPKSSTPPSPPPPTELSWSAYFARFARLAPFLWPAKSGKLQLLALACLGLLICGRAVNAMVPQVVGRVVECLGDYSEDGNHAKCVGGSIWPSILLFVALRFCQGNGGILSVGQSLLWAPVMQYSDREMSIMCFKHLLDLSLAFHTRRKTGEVLRILDRGSAINNVFQLLLMTLSPVLFDILIATVFFYWAYGWSLALVIAIVMVSYFTVSVALTTWRTKLRRQMNERDIVTRGIHTDVLMNWESVKYFTAEDRETSRYQDAVNAYQVVEYKVISSLSLLNLTQNFIITSGLLAGSLIVAWRVTKGRANAAEFVVFLTYLGQLYGPLNSLGMIYRQLNGGLVDAEKLLRLLEEEKEVVDKPDAKDLEITDGRIEFKNVTFSYDGKIDALHDVSFTVEKGESVALVGESGSGKSSLLRLLYRFYDISSGEILIDGQNIHDITQKSLRRAIGIVPQDAVLWNDTIEFNIGYGKEGASKADIVQAAQAARLHDRIMSFPDGYNTVVGERGVRLSGGEKQRVSLARTMLKAPAILVLDEATSALDTETEREVQKSLVELATGRSSLMIAHRLSTIVNADKIIVLRNGVIIEVGNHKDLIKKPDGVFAAMWKEQIRSAVQDAQSPLEEKAMEGQLVVADEAFEQPSTANKGTTVQTPTDYNDRASSPVSAGEGASAPYDLTRRISEEVKEAEGDNARVGDPEQLPALMEQSASTEQPSAVSEDVPEPPAKDISPEQTTPSKEASRPQSQVTFPPSPETPDSQIPSRPSMPHSLSETLQEGAASSSSVSPSMTRSNSDLESQSGKKDKRKRLSSIGGLVRRVSEQGKTLVRSNSSPRGGDLGSSPLASPSLGPEPEVPRPKRFSLKAKPKP